MAGRCSTLSRPTISPQAKRRLRIAVIDEEKIRNPFSQKGESGFRFFRIVNTFSNGQFSGLYRTNRSSTSSRIRLSDFYPLFCPLHLRYRQHGLRWHVIILAVDLNEIHCYRARRDFRHQLCRREIRRRFACAERRRRCVFVQARIANRWH